MHRILAVPVLLLAFAASAEAVTLRELVELSRGGLSDDILIALVEADKSSFQLTAKEIQELKKAGLSDKVLLHLIQTPELRRTESVAADEARFRVPAPEPEPVADVRARDTVVVVDRVETIAVPVPVYVPVRAHRGGRDRDDDRHEGGAHKPSRQPDPVYWGYGGKLRPDAWGQPVKKEDPPKKPIK